MIDSMSQHCPNCEAQAAEIERLREALREAAEDPDSIGGSIARAALAGKAEQ